MKKIPYRDAIALQAGVLDARRPELVAAADEFRARRHEKGVVGIMGIGASYYAALAAVREFWKVGVRAFPIDAGQLWEDEFDVADVYLTVSASGESLETVAAIQRLRRRHQGYVVSVTAESQGTLTTIADQAVACADRDDSVPATISYTGSLQALAFLASAWQAADATTHLEKAWADVPQTLRDLLERADKEVADVGDRLTEAGAIDFVGSQDSISGAAEGALLYREAPRMATAWFDSRSYLHGPMEALDERRGIVVVGDETDEGIAAILRQVRQIGCPAVHITTTPAEEPDSSVTAVAMPASQASLVRSVYEMGVLQVLSARSAEKLDLTSGRFRYPQPQVKLKQAT